MEIKKVFCIEEGRFNVQRILEFIKLNSSFKCEVYVNKNNKTINAKSILGTMNLFIYLKSGEQFTLLLKGEDAEYADKQITQFVQQQITLRSILSLG